MSCKWAGANNPRIISGRHDEDCPGEPCHGCLACTEPHCRVCGITHDAGTCGDCLAEVRTNLAEIVRMCGDLPDEVMHRGVNGEAMNLLGPVANPEAWGHRQASAKVGRIDQAWFEEADHERHPLTVLATWEDVWREALDHHSDERATVADAVRYLGQQLTYMAAYAHVPFEDFARDLRASAAHMERVLHDGEQVDHGVPCMTCHRQLERVWGKAEKADGWECKRCRTTSTEAQYQFAVKADYIAKAEWLTDVDMTVRTGVKAGTVRVWSQRDHVAKRTDSGRVVYSVAMVEARRDEQALAS